MDFLIVDDDVMIVKGLTTIIKQFNIENCHITTAFNAIDALKILGSKGTDLLITDIDMPCMNGLDLIREAQEKQYCKHFVILTGYEKFDFVRQALRYKVNDYLLKPINKEEFKTIILKVESELAGTGNASLSAGLYDLSIYKVLNKARGCSDKFRKITEYIYSHFTIDLSLEQIGAAFDLNPNYICSLFQNELNTTFLYFLDCVRLSKSIDLLLSNKNAGIKHVAMSSGFMNERHFYKVFKKRIGDTPGQFRQKYTSTDLIS